MSVEINEILCPSCSSDYTLPYLKTYNEEIRRCEGCKTFYKVEYEVKVKNVFPIKMELKSV